MARENVVVRSLGAMVAVTAAFYRFIGVLRAVNVND